MSQYEKPEIIGFQNEQDKIFPPQVVITTSAICNSQCPNCWARQGGVREREGVLFMPYDLIMKIYREAKEVKEKFGINPILRHTGMGEPFMNPHLVLALLDGIEMGLTLSVITNGSLLIPRLAKVLLDAGIDMLEFSVDAGTKEEYDKIRVGLDWDTLNKNINFILDYRKKHNKKTKVICSIVKHPGVDFERAMTYWQKKGMDDVMGRVYLTYGVLSKDNYAAEPYLDPNNRIACSHPFRRLTIVTNGNATFCNYDVRPNQGYYMGNVVKQSIQEIWQSQKFNEWRQLQLAGRWQEIPLCQECDDWKYKPWLNTYDHKVRQKAEEEMNKKIENKN